MWFCDAGREFNGEKCVRVNHPEACSMHLMDAQSAETLSRNVK